MIDRSDFSFSMIVLKSPYIALIFLLLVCKPLFSQNYDYLFRNPLIPVDNRIDDLLSRLTLEEKVAMLEHNSPGIERLDIHPFNWWNEALHGVARNGLATVLPQPIGLAATFDDDALEKAFSIVADEGRAKYNMLRDSGNYQLGLSFFTPNINIFRDPRWGRGMETYGEDPFLTGKMGSACIKGLQGSDKNYLKSLACAKHLAVHSGPENIRHQMNVSVSNYDLWTTYLPAFEYVISNTDVQQVMCGYNRLNGVPCCTNENLLVDILRNKWNFDKILVTDCWALNDCWERDTVIPRHETHLTASDASADAFSTAVDLECGSGLQALLDAVKLNTISEDVINEHVRRLLRAQFKLGLFDPDSIVPYTDYSSEYLNNQKNKDIALDMARKSIVLLENDGILPIRKQYLKIAVIGPNAYDSIMLLGNYNGTPSHAVTILEGIYNHYCFNDNSALYDNNVFSKHLQIYSDDTLLVTPNGNEIYYNKGCNLVDDDYVLQPDFDVNIANSNLVIFVGGISPSLEGEQLGIRMDGFDDGDRTRIEMPKIQKAMLQYLNLLGKRVVLVICTGSAIALDWEKKYMNAIVNAWYGGQAAGTAVADVIFGNYNPAGRLPVTFYKSTSQLPEFDDYSMSQRTYRYMDEEPTFNFGFGLSYTTFEYGNPKFDQKQMSVSCKVKNSGLIDGEEVVQVYVSNPDDKHGLNKSLVGFKRVFIKAGNTLNVTVPINTKSFYVFDDENDELVPRNGVFYLSCGSSSRDEDLKTITVKISWFEKSKD